MQARLNPDELVATAIAHAGLDDLGDVPYEAALAVLVESINDDAGLDPERLEVAGDTIVGVLVKRLRLVDDRATYPAIADERIVAPLFIVGSRARVPRICTPCWRRSRGSGRRRPGSCRCRRRPPSR